MCIRFIWSFLYLGGTYRAALELHQIPPAIQIPLLIAVGFLAGFLNTVAGGGTLISMPMLIFMGLPGTVANATNRVAILSQNLFAVAGFRSKGVKIPFPYTFYLCIVSLIGGLIGARLAVNIPDQLFNRILAIVMVAVVVATVRQHTRKKKEEPVEDLSRGKQVLGVFLFFLLGIYGGFLQAGIGFMVIALLTWVNHFSLIKTNYIKVFAALLYTGVAIVVFAFENKIDWGMGITLAVGQGLGGWVASRWSAGRGEIWIRRILVVAVVGMAIKLWFFTS
ncbi:MAG: sulfite exporter TauE/SafE family protein [Limnobacter sp.]|nr:sulfite exporter TauE/SafE family protein [Limnobacter sp.]